MTLILMATHFSSRTIVEPFGHIFLFGDLSLSASFCFYFYDFVFSFVYCSFGFFFIFFLYNSFSFLKCDYYPYGDL